MNRLVLGFVISATLGQNASADMSLSDYRDFNNSSKGFSARESDILNIYMTAIYDGFQISMLDYEKLLFCVPDGVRLNYKDFNSLIDQEVTNSKAGGFVIPSEMPISIILLSALKLEYPC